MNHDNTTPVFSPFPAHIVLLTEALRPIYTRLKTEMDSPAKGDASVWELDELMPEIDEHLDVIGGTAVHLEDKIHDLKKEVLLHPDISKPDLYCSVGRFEEVIHKLLIEYSRACRLPAYRMDTKYRDLIIEIYRYLLSEIKDWLEDFIETVADPMSAYEKRGLSMSEDITFTFVFEPSEPPQFKELDQWLKRKTTANTREISRSRAKLSADKSGRNGIIAIISFMLTSMLMTLKALTKKED